jgi:hypothetical protein
MKAFLLTIPGPFYFERGMVILRSRNGGESGGNGAFGMKTIMRFYTRVAPQPTVSVQPTDSQQRPTTRVAPARTVQDKNQNQTNSDSSAVAASH